ncbi:MAG: hypothetical protein AAF065_00550 [Verrucomicrobiota bacterium]
MPEFEESDAKINQKIDYTPSTEAANKPRTRRRSGGFKTDYTAPNTSIGEVNPADALKSEKLSGGAKPERKKEKPAPKENFSKPKAPKAEKPASTGNAQPSEATLAAIKKVEARLTERKAERDAKRAEREKTRPAKAEKKPAAQKKKAPAKKKKQSGGIIASILGIFGLGPKEPVKKKGGKGNPRGGKGQGGRPQGKGGNRSQGGGNGQNRRGGKGRRRSGKGGPRQGDRRNNETVS